MALKKFARRDVILPAVVFLLTFVVALFSLRLLSLNQEKDERLRAVYAAESTISRVSSQLNRYLAESDFIKKYIESGHVLREEGFAVISSNMQDGSSVIKTHELAKDGVVSQVYPVAGNEAAIGLDMLHNPARKRKQTLPRTAGCTPSLVPSSWCRAARARCCSTPSIPIVKRGSARSGASPSLFYSGTTSLRRSSWTRWRMLATGIKSGKRPLYRRKDRHRGERRGFPRQCAGSCVQRPQRYMVF